MKDSWALITGASSGMGWAIAQALATRRVNLLVNARRKERLLSLKNEFVSQHGVQVETLVFDIRDLKQCQSALKEKASLVSRIVTTFPHGVSDPNKKIPRLWFFQHSRPSLDGQFIFLSCMQYILRKPIRCVRFPETVGPLLADANSFL